MSGATQTALQITERYGYSKVYTPQWGVEKDKFHKVTWIVFLILYKRPATMDPGAAILVLEYIYFHSVLFGEGHPYVPVKLRRKLIKIKLSRISQVQFSIYTQNRQRESIYFYLSFCWFSRVNTIIPLITANRNRWSLKEEEPIKYTYTGL